MSGKAYDIRVRVRYLKYRAWAIFRGDPPLRPDRIMYFHFCGTVARGIVKGGQRRYDRDGSQHMVYDVEHVYQAIDNAGNICPQTCISEVRYPLWGDQK